MNLKKISQNFFKFFTPALILILLVSGFYWKVFIKNEVPIPGDFIVGVYFPWLDYKWGYAVGVPVKNPITTDVTSLIYPEQILAVNMMKSGVAPLWNRFILAGTPLFANLQAAPYSVTNFLYFVFGDLTAWSLQVILQHILAAFFMYLLLRRWKVSPFGSVFGGFVYAFCGFNLIFSEWNGHTLTSAFIPLIVYFVDKWIAEGRIVYGLGFSIACALQLMAGYPQTSLYTAIIVLVYWMFLIKRQKMFLLRSFGLVVFGMIGLFLSAVQILPTVELWKLSQRDFEPHPYEWAFLPWKKAITIISSEFFGNHATKNYWGPQDYTSNTMFVGVSAFIVSLFTVSIKYLKKNRTVIFLWVVVLLSVVLSFATPLSYWLWANNIFGMRAASAHRATIMFCFAISGICAFGFDYLRKNKIKIFKIIGIFLPIFLVMIIFVLYALSLRGLVTRSGIVPTTVALRNLVLPFFVFGVLLFVFMLSIRVKIVRKSLRFVIILMSVIELFYFGWKFTPFSPRSIVFPTTPVIDFLMSQNPPFRTTGNKVIPVNMRTPYGLESLEGYETIHPVRISQFLSALNSGISGTNPVGRYGTVDNETSSLLDLVNTKFYLALKTDEKIFTDDPARFKKIFNDKSVDIFESKSALPRAFMVYSWEVNANGNEILDKLLNAKYPYREKIMIEEPLAQKIEVGQDTKNNVSYAFYDSQKSEIDVQTDSDGLLFVSDSYYPGWNAYVDGVKTKIYRADYAFRSIPVSKGQHIVKMVYAPDSFKNGFHVSLATLAFVVILGILGEIWRRNTG